MLDFMDFYVVSAEFWLKGRKKGFDGLTFVQLSPLSLVGFPDEGSHSA